MLGILLEYPTSLLMSHSTIVIKRLNNSSAISSGIATGGQGGQSAPLTVKHLPKIGKKERENQEKLGWFLHFAPPDR